ncbi:hypothetical protein, partial [Flavobacterium sp. 245]|uniref:hypothetical protein n=1 Tax=Flavobacterium sp. 245 TaxID=2512115 RepID=UPI001AACE743
VAFLLRILPDLSGGIFCFMALCVFWPQRTQSLFSVRLTMPLSSPQRLFLEDFAQIFAFAVRQQ